MPGKPMQGIAAVALLAVFLIHPRFVSADEVTLENGDRLTGTVVKMEKNVLTLKTDYSQQPIEIKAAKIKQLRTDSDVTLKLITGEILKGKVLSEKEGMLAVQVTPERATTAVELKSVAGINLPPVKWEGNITIGGSSQSGNTNTGAFSVAASAMRRTEKTRMAFSYLFNYAEEDKQMIARSHYGTTDYAYFFTKKFYGYLALELLNNTFEDIELRTTVGPGVGYQIWEDPVKALALEAGASYLSETHKSGSNEYYWAARLGINFRYNILSFLIFSDRFLYFPRFESSSQYTLRNEAAVASPLGSAWALRLAYILQYNNEPAPGVEKTDNTWILGLQYSFK
jgi:putative salt-induced outer membrane protein YdiY